MPESTGHRRRTVMIAVTTGAVALVAAIAVAVGLSGGSDDEGTVAQPSSETDSGQRTGDSSDGGPGDDGAGGDDTPEAAAGEATLIPEPMGGQAAVDALGDKLRVVAQRNDMTVDELRELLLRDDDLRVSPAGTLLYGDTMTPPPPATPPAED